MPLISAAYVSAVAENSDFRSSFGCKVITLKNEKFDIITKEQLIF